ncbi:MAG: hypothetical protein IPK87_15405 [Planctomycetes bacterium]|nr:hypothetical protein [Planctomycetota bacterium]
MSNPTQEMLDALTTELAGHGVSMKTLSAQAAGKLGMDAPDGLAKLAQVFEPEYALMFFEFLKGLQMTPAEAVPAAPNPADLEPALRAAFAELPIESAEKEKLIASLVNPFTETAAGDAVPAADAPDEQQMLDDLNKQAKKLQAELDKQIAELKPPEVEPAKPGEPEPPLPESEQGVEKLKQAAQELSNALEKALKDLPASPA